MTKKSDSKKKSSLKAKQELKDTKKGAKKSKDAKAKKIKKEKKAKAEHGKGTCGNSQGHRKGAKNCCVAQGVAARKGCKAASMVRNLDASAVLDRRCPRCGKHCPLTKPKCGKGRKLAAKLLEKAKASA